MEITIEQAIAAVDKACAAFTGNRDQHVLLLKSLELIRNKCLSEKQPEQKTDEVQ